MFMKKILLILMTIFSMVSMAQDVVVLKDGDVIQTKVVEVGENEVKYKKWENIDGPTYTMSISKILAINYQNGTKDSFTIQNSEAEKKQVKTSEEFSYSELQKVNKNKNIDFLKREELLRRARTNNITGTIIAIGGVVGGICLGYFGEGQSFWGATLALGITGFLGGCMYWYQGAELKKEAYQINIASIPVDCIIINDNVKIEPSIVCFESTMGEFTSLGIGAKVFF